MIKLRIRTKRTKLDALASELDPILNCENIHSHLRVHHTKDVSLNSNGGLQYMLVITDSDNLRDPIGVLVNVDREGIVSFDQTCVSKDDLPKKYRNLLKS